METANVTIACAGFGSALIAWALYLGHNGVLLSSWLLVLGGLGGYEFKAFKYKTAPPP